MILGASADLNPVLRKEESEKNQMSDMKITFTCPDQWQIEGQTEPTSYNKMQEILLKTDPETCKLISKLDDPMLKAEFEKITKEHKDRDKTWERVKFTLLSMLISSSFLASFNITTFYTGVSVVIGGQARKAFLYFSFTAWQYEKTHPEAIIKLIEYIV